jgi:hypothetical protein
MIRTPEKLIEYAAIACALLGKDRLAYGLQPLEPVGLIGREEILLEAA